MLSQRGPDLQGQHTVKFPAAEIEFRGYVLWQQGDVPCSQPVVKNNHVMLLNGDIYNKLGNPLLSDTQWLFEQLTMIDQSEVNVFCDSVLRTYITILNLNMYRTITRSSICSAWSKVRTVWFI